MSVSLQLQIGEWNEGMCRMHKHISDNSTFGPHLKASINGNSGEICALARFV